MIIAGVKYRLVPEVATQEMERAGFTELMGHRIYQAMLAAAPQPPEEELERLILDEIMRGFEHQDTAAKLARAIVRRLMGES
jgi:hypothetical protein